MRHLFTATLLTVSLLSSPALAVVDLSWDWVDSPKDCTQSESCPLTITVTREATSTEPWPVNDLCNQSGAILSGLHTLAFQQALTSPAICSSQEVLTGAGQTSSVITVGTIVDPDTSPIDTYFVLLDLQIGAADSVVNASLLSVNLVAPSGQTFAELCAQPNNIYCNGFESLSGAAFNNSNDLTFPLTIDNTIFFEGGGSLLLIVDGTNDQELTGTIGYSHPMVTTGSMFTYFRIRFGDGLQSLFKSQQWVANGSGGPKYFILVEGQASCSSTSVVLYDTNAGTGILSGVTTVVQSCSGFQVQGGDGDLQPGGTLGNCSSSYITSTRPSGPVESPPCHLMQDDTWHEIEFETIVGVGYRAWLDGVKFMDTTSRPSVGPFGRIYLGMFLTGYGVGVNPNPMQGTRTLGDGLWRVWYDNLVKSTSCITSCGL